MAGNRPTLPELIDQTAAEMESRLPGVLARARRSLVGVLVRVIAGALDALYKYIGWLFEQAWPDQCGPEYLLAHGARWGVTPTPASAATGALMIGGTVGATLPAGTVFQRADGARFTTDASVILAGTSAVIAITAEAVGQAGNTTAGAAFTLVSPVAGINSAAVADSNISGGADDEDAERFRARILERIRRPPHGGSEDDYVEWAKQVPGVTRAWCTPNGMGAGTVVVRFVRDDDEDILPDASEIEDVRVYIEARRPVTAELYVLPLAPRPIQFVISEISPDTAEVRNAVVAELKDMLARDAVPGGKILTSHINEAISIAAGEVDHVLASPSGNVVCAVNEMAVFGGVTWAP